MKVIKKGTALLVCLAMMLTISQVAPKSRATATTTSKSAAAGAETVTAKSVTTGEAVSITASVKDVNRFGDIDLDTTADDFFKAGFEFGDIVTITIEDVSMDMPVVDYFMEVDVYRDICLILNGTANVCLGTECGILAEELPFEVKAGMKVTITMKEKGGYLEEYKERKLVRTYERTDYPDLSDEEYANFRVVSTTGMGKDVLYRSSSPVDPEISRNTYALTATEKYGIKTVLNANDTDEVMKNYPTYPGSYYANCNVIPLGMLMDFRVPDFEKKFAEALRYMIKKPGPYLVHCVEGKDRTGFMCAVLEAFMGASAEEILDDYMITFYNYYGVKQGEKRYDFIRNGNLPISLKIAFGFSDFYTADLSAAAETYMKRIGLTAKEISKLRQRLAVGTPAADITDNSKMISLKANKTYKKYDVTCDGKTDTVRVKYNEKKNGNNSMQISINGKVVYKKKAYYLTPNVKILHFDKKNQLIAAGHSGEDDMSLVKLYSYKNKKWKLIRNLNKSGLSSKYSYGGKPVITGITATSVTVEYHHQMPMIGGDTFEFTYLYDGKKMKLKKEDTVIKIYHYNGPDYESNGYESDATLEAKRTMKVYADSSTSSGTVAEIQKDDKVIFHLMRVVSKRPWFYVTIGRTTGWLPAGVAKYDENDTGDEGAGYYFKWLLFYS